ncbi:YihY/virulence factor BrkB family protein [Streptomyces sp. 549]|uniref:YihY/virulence factor BrkB family protein n=1 Tax=Streptomyces sp. 549 TaxID=3049076 RepID=UPI0024C3C446|nr:YihY/virulence factor BrkB family protein [Streptomyces sp. 549]MDK1475242.1 YihY/virulence factor BrkB family protein [Streptomyces sp. 549]
MRAATSPPNRPSRRRARTRLLYRNIPKRRLTWLLLKDTVNSCIEYRILGLAAEAAFFTLLSLPPLLMGLLGLLGYLDSWIGTDTIASVRDNILDASATVLSERGVNDIAAPLIDDVIDGGRPDIISFGFALALWSGSRAVNVFIDTITVMYGLDGHRGIVKTRLLAFLLYIIALLIGAVALPLMVVGPNAVISWVPQAELLVRIFYWPTVLLLSVVFLTTLFHVSVPVRSPWREDIPGAMVSLLMWVGGSFLLRIYLTSTVEGPTIYGSLAAPVAILLWIFISAFAVLVGAAVNAAIDRVWPSVATAAARRARDRQREKEAAEVIAAVAARRAVREARAGPDAAPDGGDTGDGGDADERGTPGTGDDGDAARGADDGEEEPGTADGPGQPAEFPERWARFLPPEDVRSRLKGPPRD